LKEGRWWFNPTILFSATQGVLLHAFVFDPETFPSAMGNFIMRFSTSYLPAAPRTNNLPDLEWPNTRQIVNFIATSSRLNHPAFTKSTAFFEKDLVLAKVFPVIQSTASGHSHLICSVLHPSEINCRSVFTGFVKKEFVASSKFFAGLAILSSLLRWKKVINRFVYAIPSIRMKSPSE
jgi:hypothetical protein